MTTEMITHKRIKVVSRGLRGERHYVFYDGFMVVNHNTRGVLFTGLDRIRGNNKTKETRYLPFDLILRVTVEDYDGGVVFVRDPRLLKIALDVAQVYQPEDYKND